MSQPFSAAAERNKVVIGDALASYLHNVSAVLEIGSGTGQHAVYLAERFGSLHWQPTDRAENLTGINSRVAASGLNNIARAVEMDVENPQQLSSLFDFAYSANTAHIMSETAVAGMYNVVANHLKPNTFFALYGPFKYRGAHTSKSNEQFDSMLRQQASHMGIRDKATLDAMAFDCGLDFIEDIAMPSNNRILVWRR